MLSSIIVSPAVEIVNRGFFSTANRRRSVGWFLRARYLARYINSLTFTKKITVMEQAVEKMKEMQFSPRFVRGCERSLCERLIHLHSPVNALIVFDRKRCIVEKTKSYLYICHSPSPFKKNCNTELICDSELLSIYRQSRDDRSDFIIESDKKIFAWFNYDYKSSPVIMESKINAEGQDFNILFLSFLNEQETISIISTDRPTFFTGLPFALTLVSNNEAVLQCGRKATFSLERLERVSSSLTFSF